MVILCSKLSTIYNKSLLTYIFSNFRLLFESLDCSLVYDHHDLHGKLWVYLNWDEQIAYFSRLTSLRLDSQQCSLTKRDPVHSCFACSDWHASELLVFTWTTDVYCSNSWKNNAPSKTLSKILKYQKGSLMPPNGQSTIMLNINESPFNVQSTAVEIHKLVLKR